MKDLADCFLYAFVDTTYLRGRKPDEVARLLCQGGADLIQLRAKGASKDQIRDMAEAILPATRPAGVGLVVNDHLEAALESGAESCHLGQEDFFDQGFQHISDLPLGRKSLQIGLSSHSPEQAARAIKAGAHYLGAGPVFPTGTKPSAQPVTLDYVRWAAANVKIPWFAIGGINLANLDDVLAAGARRICVVSAILEAPDPVAACQAFKRRLLAAANR